MSNWNELWLKEGFARLLEHVAVCEIEPEYDIFVQYMHTVYDLAMHADSDPDTVHPVVGFFRLFFTP